MTKQIDIVKIMHEVVTILLYFADEHYLQNRARI